MRLNRHPTLSAFTLVETAVAAAVLLIFSLGALLTMTAVNRQANIARSQTLALAFAQQKIDEILTTPWQLNSARPTLLTASTTTDSNFGLGDDPLNAQTGLSSTYTTLDIRIKADRTTTVTDLSSRMVKAVVTVVYTYRGKNYTVSLTTIRAADTI